MRTLLIVEDEKMIRQGLATMAERADVPVEQIIQCRNGIEALNMINDVSVDAVLTDIRMPQMDGIELVKQISKMKNPPQVAVVSGFEDFNYAVTMMKYGVIDYILKPVKRDKVQEVLQKIEHKLSIELEQKSNSKSVFLHQLKSIIMGDSLIEEAVLSLEHQFAQYLQQDKYHVLISNQFPDRLEDRLGCFVMKEVEDQQVAFCQRKEVERLLSELPDGAGVGISSCYGLLADVKTAYDEALVARKIAFVKGRNYYQYEDNKRIATDLPEYFCEQFVQRFPTNKYEESYKELQNLYFQTVHDKVDVDKMIVCINQIQEQLKAKYPNSIQEALQPLMYSNLDAYREKEKQWMPEIRSSLKVQFDTDKNHDKIHKALDYIKANYCSELNMAMVSNHVSMNYSLFSIAFKEYTGVNFVNYLKLIRIEEAKRLLEETDDKVLDISKKVGYENEKHFMKTFKKMCGVSPTEYRKNITVA